MKEKVIIFLVGLLLGSIISTGSIYVYTLVSNSNKGNMGMQMGDVRGGEMMQDGTNPPEIPDGQDNNMDRR